jgi:hypothetical protein
MPALNSYDVLYNFTVEGFILFFVLNWKEPKSDSITITITVTITVTSANNQYRYGQDRVDQQFGILEQKIGEGLEYKF